MRSRFALALLASLILTGVASAQAPAIKWGPAPAVFPAGTRMAVLQGDPSQAAMFTVRIELPAGMRVAPHFHPTDEQLTVISGTFLVGMGDSIIVSKAMVLPTGAFATAPANAHHWAMARGRTVVQVSAIGPFVLTYVNPKDMPNQTASK
ncbi:MAG TPA: cupin domain-containing protein [Gemmatimonadales bacterium]|nr:cupin domain-containing protein [Gemmatimonadales bacterium]